MTVVKLPGTGMTAQELAADLAARDDIVQIIALVTRNDGGTQLVYTPTTPQDIAMASVVMHDAAMRAAMGTDPDRETVRGNPRNIPTVGVMVDASLSAAEQDRILGGGPPPGTVKAHRCNRCRRTTLNLADLITGCADHSDCPVQQALREAPSAAGATAIAEAPPAPLADNVVQLKPKE